MAPFRRRDVSKMTFDEGVKYFTQKIPDLAHLKTNQQIIDRLNDYRGSIKDPNDRVAHDIFVFLTQVCKYDFLEVKPPGL